MDRSMQVTTYSCLILGTCGVQQGIQQGAASLRSHFHCNVQRSVGDPAMQIMNIRFSFTQALLALFWFAKFQLELDPCCRKAYYVVFALAQKSTQSTGAFQTHIKGEHTLCCSDMSVKKDKCLLPHGRILNLPATVLNYFCPSWLGNDT